jgi:hypothetical protein
VRVGLAGSLVRLGELAMPTYPPVTGLAIGRSARARAVAAILRSLAEEIKVQEEWLWLIADQPPFEFQLEHAPLFTLVWTDLRAQRSVMRAVNTTRTSAAFVIECLNQLNAIEKALFREHVVEAITNLVGPQTPFTREEYLEVQALLRAVPDDATERERTLRIDTSRQLQLVHPKFKHVPLPPIRWPAPPS